MAPRAEENRCESQKQLDRTSPESFVVFSGPSTLGLPLSLPSVVNLHTYILTYTRSSNCIEFCFTSHASLCRWPRAPANAATANPSRDFKHRTPKSLFSIAGLSHIPISLSRIEFKYSIAIIKSPLIHLRPIGPVTDFAREKTWLCESVRSDVRCYISGEAN